MTPEALRVRSRFHVTRGRFEPSLPRRGLAVWFVAALALAVSSCQSAPTGPVSLSAAYLQFTGEPPVYSTVGRPLSSPVQVSVVDALGRSLTGFSTTVTVTLGPNLEGATLFGTTTVPTSGGVATFSDLSVDRRGTYYLVATAGDLPWAGSAPFEIDRGSPGAGAQVVSGNEGSGRVDVIRVAKRPATTGAGGGAAH